MWNIHNFEAETWRILELLTHSIYSNKEIFLREIISNSSDAIDKAKIESIKDTNYLKEWEEFEIKIRIDDTNKVIIIEDNWIWMSKEDLINNLWTIAKSWTKDFLDKLEDIKNSKNHNLIWQFWVGFYSSFMVASKVEVESLKHNEVKSYKWISDGKSWYEILDWNKIERWTIIKIYINEENTEFLQDWKLKELVKKYSNYIPIKIMFEVDDTNEIEKDWKKETIVIWKKWQLINEIKAIWKKNKTELTKEDANDFYKSISMDFNESLWYILINSEWILNYRSIIFIPKEKNMFFDINDPSREYWLKLYIQNILILEYSKDLLPVWLRFISWVVETNDLPLNISREILQSNPNLNKIRKWIIKKILVELKKIMKEESESYDKFLDNFWQILKEWIHYEHEMKEEIAWIVKFKSFLSNKLISFDEYITNFTHEEKNIYYISWKSEWEVLASPYLSQFRENNIDVLLFTSAIDSFILQTLTEYSWIKLKSVSSWDINLKNETEEEKQEKEELKKDFKDFLELTKNLIWSDIIEKVELNDKLWDAIWALKTPDWWMTPQMEKMMKAMWQHIPNQKRILELNPNTLLVKSMKLQFSLDIKSEKLQDMIRYAYLQAVLLEWWELNNINEFISLTNKFAWNYIK